MSLPNEGGKAKVASQSNGTTAYHIVNGECSCKDFPKAPQGFCKHRLAYGIHKRAYTLAKQKLAQLDSASSGQAETPSQPTPTQPPAPSAPLPEAPVETAGHTTAACGTHPGAPFREVCRAAPDGA
jgi:hypothetical protein